MNAHGEDDDDNSDAYIDDRNGRLSVRWERCEGSTAMGVLLCLDEMSAINRLKMRRNMEHRVEYCPKSSPRCLVPLPEWYKIPFPCPMVTLMLIRTYVIKLCCLSFKGALFQKVYILRC